MKILSKIYHYNFVLLETRKSKGITQIQLAQAVGIAPTIMSKIEMLQDVSHCENIRSKLEDIADFLEIPFDEMFPPEYIKALFARRLKYHKYWLREDTIELLASGAVKLLPSGNDPCLDMASKDIGYQQLRDFIKELPAKEARILDLRFGLTGGSHTLEETGKLMGITRERVRQFEAQALARLRHPRYSKHLRDVLLES